MKIVCSMKAPLLFIDLKLKTPSASPLKNILILLISSDWLYLKRYLRIIKSRKTVKNANIKNESEICFSSITCQIRSNWRLSANRMNPKRKIKSTKRSVIIVPNVFSKGIFS